MKSFLRRTFLARCVIERRKQNKRKKFCNRFLDVTITENVLFDEKTVLGGHNIIFVEGDIRGATIGNHTYASTIFLPNSKIGSFTSIASVKVVARQHPINWISTSPFFYNNNSDAFQRLANKEFECNIKTPNGYLCEIGNDVWIGENVLIKGGVTIGNGAIVGMGSVVTKDVPPYAIVAGVPARIIRFRFPEKIIKQLETLKWWDWPEEKIVQKGIVIDDVNRFLDLEPSTII